MARKKGEIKRCLDWQTAMTVFQTKINRAVREGAGLSLTQARILFTLAIQPGTKMGAITQSLILKPSTVTAAVDAMEDSALLTRANGSEDSRQIFATLTKKGYELIPACLDSCAKACEELRVCVDPEKLELLAQAVLPQGPTSALEGDDGPALSIDEICDALRIPIDEGARTSAIRVLYVEKIARSMNELTFFESSYDLTLRGARILRYLDVKGGSCSLRQLRHDICSPSNIVTSYLDKLCSAGLVVREPSEKDRRMVEVVLTKEGARRVRKSSEAYLQRFEECFPQLCGLETKDFLVKFPA